MSARWQCCVLTAKDGETGANEANGRVTEDLKGYTFRSDYSIVKPNPSISKRKNKEINGMYAKMSSFVPDARLRS